MAGPERIGSNQVRPTTIQQKQVGPSKTGLDNTAIAESAISSIEFNRTAAGAGGSGSLLGQGAGLVDGGSSLSQTQMGGTFSLNALEVHQVGEDASMFDQSAMHTSPQDIHAANTETAARADALSEAHLNQTVETLTQFAETAEAVASQSTQEMVESVGMEMKKLVANMEKEEGAAGEGAGFALNGEDGKAFGDFSKLAAQVSQQKGIDLKNMPIEDAVMLIFMLISEDAKKDVRAQLEDMDLTRRKKASLREAEGLLREEVANIKKNAKDVWDNLPADPPKEEFDKWLGTQTVVMPTIQTDEATGKAVVVSAGGFVGGTEAPVAKSFSETIEGGEKIGGVPTTFAGLENSINDIKDKRDSFSEMSEMQQLKMQTYMDRMTKADTANSNLMKKLSDTLNSIISNMK